MVLAIDIGNTNIVLGVYDGDELVFNCRIVSDHNKSADSYSEELQRKFNEAGIATDAIKGVIIASVVPPLEPIMEQLCKHCFDIRPHFISSATDVGMKINYSEPQALGADRLVNAVSAFQKYRRSLIVIDFGTATTFDYVSPGGEYMGGAIAPGIAISATALFQQAARLPSIDLHCPERVVGTTTRHSMQSGIVYGYISLVEGIVARIKEEVATDPFTVATGGLASQVAAWTKAIDAVDAFLMLRGLKIIYDRIGPRS